MTQLDPFDPIYRPILFKVKNQNNIKDIENVSWKFSYNFDSFLTLEFLNSIFIHFQIF